MKTNIKKEIQIIHLLALHKIKIQYADQMFGYLWALVNPLVYIFSFWFFAYVGLRNHPDVFGVEYVVWIIPGLLAYRFISSLFALSSVMLTMNRMLIRETRIKAWKVPLIEVVKELYVHFAVLVFMFFFYALVGFTMTGTWEYLPKIVYLNFIYYFITMFAFGIGMAYIVSVLGVLFRDVKNIINALMVPLLWMTPVLFPVENGVRPIVEKAAMLTNPFYYFVDGYRDTMVYHIPFYENGLYNIYMWFLILIMLLIGRSLWKFVSPIIADLV